jgi:hypothetical protein
MLAGVVAVIAIAGGIVVATGSDDDASPGADQAADGDPADDGATADEAPADGAGTSPTAPLSPVEVAEDFFAAVDARDCEGIVGRMTPESYATDGQTAGQAVAECESDRSGTAAAAAAEFGDITLVSERGDTATVSVTVTMEGVTKARQLPLRRVDGEWLMHLDTSLVEPAT